MAEEAAVSFVTCPYTERTLSGSRRIFVGRGYSTQVGSSVISENVPPARNCALVLTNRQRYSESVALFSNDCNECALYVLVVRQMRSYYFYNTASACKIYLSW